MAYHEFQSGWTRLLLISMVATLCGCHSAPARLPTPTVLAPTVGKDLDALLHHDPNAVHALDGFGRTRLHFAAGRGHTDTVERLLDHGARIDARDRWGWTPLSAAVEADDPQMVGLLLAKGADVDARNRDGWTALNLAALLGHPEIVHTLLEAGADLHTANRWGQTVLHSAARNWHKQVFVALWKTGANPDAHDMAGMTARQFVEKRGYSWKKLFLDQTGVLPATWVFRQQYGSHETAEEEQWNIADPTPPHWRPISTETFWTLQPFPGIWHGTGWYRVDFTVEQIGLDPETVSAAKKVLVLFGAIDGHPKVWLNGTLVGEHHEDLNKTWDKTWTVDVTDVIRTGQINKLAVSCTKKAYAAGIHPGVDKQPVRLVIE